MSREPTKKVHVLKTWALQFQAVWDRRKLFEFRRDDRGFEVGDGVELLEYFPAEGIIGVREIEADITYVARGPSFGIPEGYAVLSLDLIRARDHGGIAWEVAGESPTDEELPCSS